MALSKNVNSYVTVAEADSYFLDRLDVAAWSAASETEKAQALITATAVMDDMDWIGYAISDSQTLAFPRNGSYFDPRVGLEVLLDTSIPKRIIVANCELAYHLLNNDGLLDDTGALDSLQIGSISLQKVRSANKIPMSVKRMLKPLLSKGGVSSWWRAN